MVGRTSSESVSYFVHGLGGCFCKRYADLLQKKLDMHGTQCYLINTGWTGGGYGVGKRMSLKETRACVNSVLDGSINDASFTADPVG